MGANAKNGAVRIGDTDMCYASFGHGIKPLILLPGLSDGLANVKGKALILSGAYKLFFDEYKVYMFSRKNDMPDNYTISDMAEDQISALLSLGIEKANIVGVSQGGMIAQYIAIKHPDIVEKLVLAVTAPYANDTVRERIGHWMQLAKKGGHKALMIDTAESSYSESYLKKFRRIYPFIGLIGKPKSYRRFLINAEAILKFSALDELSGITCPTLIIGGDSDKVVGTKAAYELSDRIAGSKLHIYKGLGHAAYEEAKDFNERIYEFLAL